MFGAGFADPNYAAADGIQFIVARDDLNHLSGPQPETATEAEAPLRAVNDKTGNPLGVRAEVDDNAGSLSRDSAFRAAAFVRLKGGHCFVLNEDSHNTPIMERVP